MLDFWHNYKVRYLRKHNTLDFDSMRELSVPSRIINGLTRPRLYPTNYRTRGGEANHYITDVILLLRNTLFLVKKHQIQICEEQT
jgi:hypothetical protein